MSRERWQELDEKATPGPWGVRIVGGRDYTDEYWSQITVDFTQDDKLGTGPGAMLGDHEEAEADAQFIAAARTAWPAAERECEQLRAERDQVLALLRAVRGELGSWINSTEASDALRLIATSGLLDDEGQQPLR